MSSPAYNRFFTTVKNLQILSRYLKLPQIASTRETVTAQLIHHIVSFLGLEDPIISTLTAASAQTYTVPQFSSGLILRDPNGAARTDTTPTAAAIIAGMAMTANYQQRFVSIHNNADAAETITLAAGVGVTLKGTITAEQSTVIKLCIVRTSSTTVAIRQV